MKAIAGILLLLCFLVPIASADFVPLDIWMEGEFLQAFTVTDASTGIPISGATILSSSGNTNITAVTGVGYLTEPFGAFVVTFTATGYDGRMISYVFDADESHAVQLTKTVTPPTSQYNTWYTPHQVRFAVMDSRNNAKLPGVSVNVTAIQSSFPNGSVASWPTELYGIDPNAANDMMNGTLMMRASTASDGSVVFTMLPSIYYRIELSQASTGSTNSVTVMPIDNMYTIMLVTGSATNSSYADRGYNTSLYITEPDINHVMMNVKYEDMSGRTTLVEMYTVARVNNTVIDYRSIVPTGSGSVYLNFTVDNIKRTSYTWYYNAVRVK